MRYPNVYGIDMPSAGELVAHNRTDQEIAEVIGADWLIYQDLADLEAAVRRHSDRLKRFDTSCFNGVYVTGDVSKEFLERQEQQRNDAAKAAQRKLDQMAVDLHNAP